MADHHQEEEEEEEEDEEEEEKYYEPYSLTQIDDYGVLNNLMPVDKVIQCLENIVEEFMSTEASKEIKADIKQRGCIEWVMLRSLELSKKKAEGAIGRTLKLQPRHDDVEMDLREFFGYVQHYPQNERVVSLMKEMEPLFLPFNVHSVTKLDKSELPPVVTSTPEEEKAKEKEKEKQRQDNSNSKDRSMASNRGNTRERKGAAAGTSKITRADNRENRRAARR